MNFKNDGLTVGELSIAVASLIIIGFLWAHLSKDRGNQEVSMVINDSSAINYQKEL